MPAVTQAVTAVSTSVVVFSPAEFKENYPQFADFTDARLETFFSMACQFVDNSEHSAVPYNPPQVNTRKIILELLVCHIAELELRGGGIVGNMTGVTEGSVSASFAAPAHSGGQWYRQTQCGAAVWQLLTTTMLGGKLYHACDQ